jgi:membrane-associated phospholipid phosphatase
MAYARVALGVHFPTDTLGGLLLGICWFALTAAFV